MFQLCPHSFGFPPFFESFCVVISKWDALLSFFLTPFKVFFALPSLSIVWCSRSFGVLTLSHQIFWWFQLYSHLFPHDSFNFCWRSFLFLLFPANSNEENTNFFVLQLCSHSFCFPAFFESFCVVTSKWDALLSFSLTPFKAFFALPSLSNVWCSRSFGVLTLSHQSFWCFQLYSHLFPHDSFNFVSALTFFCCFHQIQMKK